MSKISVFLFGKSFLDLESRTKSQLGLPLI